MGIHTIQCDAFPHEKECQWEYSRCASCHTRLDNNSIPQKGADEHSSIFHSEVGFRSFSPSLPAWIGLRQMCLCSWPMQCMWSSAFPCVSSLFQSLSLYYLLWCFYSGIVLFLYFFSSFLLLFFINGTRVYAQKWLYHYDSLLSSIESNQATSILFILPLFYIFCI